MVAEPDAHHVIDLALHEIGAFPEVRQRGDFAIRFGHTGLEPDAMAFADRIEFIDDLKPLLVIRPIHGTDVHDVIEIHVGIIMEKPSHVVHRLATHGHGQIAAPFNRLDEPPREFPLEALGYWMHSKTSAK